NPWSRPTKPRCGPACAASGVLPSGRVSGCSPGDLSDGSQACGGCVLTPRLTIVDNLRSTGSRAIPSRQVPRVPQIASGDGAGDLRAGAAATEYEARLSAVRAAMAERSLSALVVTDPANLYYLIGYNAWSFYTPQCLVVPAEGDLQFF